MNPKKIIGIFFAIVVFSHSFAQKVTTKTGDNVTYAVISSEGMVKGYETRNTTTSGTNPLYYSTPLYTYSDKGTMPPPGATDRDPAYSWPVYVNGISGDIVQVMRMVRHDHYFRNGSYSFPGGTSTGIKSAYTPNNKISTLFAVAPVDIYDDGEITPGDKNSMTMTWASAAGYLASANGNPTSVNSTATEKGCYMYKGVTGNDLPGTWRLPTLRELVLMWVLRIPLNNTKDKTAFVDFALRSYYWSATESSDTSAKAFEFWKGTSTSLSKDERYRVRCVRDMTPEVVKK